MFNKQLTILAIDDNPDNLTVLKAVITDVFPGVKYISALNGKKGLELAVSEDPDVILLDILMPVMDGFEVCRALKKNEATQVIPVIFLTSMSNSRDVRLKALEAGAEGFLCKPVDETDLLAQIQSMAKIKTGNLSIIKQKKELEEQVKDRTHDIEQELILRRKAEKDLIEVNKYLSDSQATLYESEELYRLITENVSDMISKHSLEGKYTFVSPSCKSILGYEPDELIGVDPYDLFHPESIEMIRVTHRKIIETQDVTNNTFRIRRKDGNYIWFETSNTTIRDKTNNEPIEILCVSRDITNKKEEANMLKQMTVFAEEMMLTGNKQISFQKILQNILFITKAKYAALNLINEKTDIFATVEIAGVGDKMKKLSEALGFELIGKEWKSYKKKADRIENYAITCFSSIGDIIGNELPKCVLMAIEKLFDVGEVDTIQIIVDNHLIGDIALIMPAGKYCKNKSLLQIYSRQIDSFFTRITAEKNLKESEELLKSIVENSQDAFFRRKVSIGKYEYMSPAIKRVLGFTNEEMIAMPFEQVMSRVHPDDLKGLTAAMINSFSNGEDYFEIEYRFLDKSEQYCWLWYRSKLARDEFDKPAVVFGTISNVNERKKSEAEIIYLNYHDHLTGLYNRRFYEEELHRLDTKRNLPLSVIMGDVNGLKLINDSFGHEMGDELLIQVAEAIKKGCRADDIISRHGGDEFVIILPKTDSKEAEQIINRIQSFLLKEKVCALDVSVSFGYATKNDEEESIENTLKASEEFMYKNKLYEGSSTRSKTINIIINALYEKSKREMLHSERVSKLCEAIAMQMNLGNDEVKLIKTAGYMHDIGKIGIDETILNKNDKLSSAEWMEMRKHTEAGYRILSAASEFSEIADCILQHHERWDGDGYPIGLKGENINLHARIIAVADSYDAMTTVRTYKKGLSKEEAEIEIKQGAGTQFDPEIAKVFIEKVLSKPL